MRNASRHQGKKDRFAFLAQWTTVLYPILLLLFLIPALLVGLGLGGWLGYLAGTESELLTRGSILIQILLIVPMVVVIIIPVGQGLQTQEWVERRFLLLPISTNHLFLGSLGAAYLDPWMLACAAPFIACPIGALIAGSPLLALILAVGGFLYVASLGALSSWASHLTTLLLRDRKRAEWFFLIFVLGLSGAGMVPLFLQHTLGENGGALLAQGLFSLNVPGACFNHLLNPYSQMAPAFVQQIAALVVNGGFLVFVLVLSRSAHTKLLTTVESSGSGKSTKNQLFRLPWLPDSISSVAAAHLLSYLRTTPGKLALFGGPMVVFMFGLIQSFVRADKAKHLDARVSEWMGMSLPALAVFFALVALLNLIVNQFVIDGSGFTLQALKPLTPQQLIQARLWSYRLFFTIALVAGIIPALFLSHLSGSAWFLFLTFIPLGYAALHVVFPLGVILSVFFPKKMDLTRLGKSSQPHQLAVLFGMMANALGVGLCLGPLMLLFLAGLPHWGLPIVACVELLVILFFSNRLLPSLGRLVEKRWERLVMEAQAAR